MFFRESPFGLDISDSSIKALQLGFSFGKFYLKSYGRVELEEGIVEDGKILNFEKLKEKIKDLLKSTFPRKIKSKLVILALPESRTFIKTFNFPADLIGQDLDQAIQAEVLKTIPLEREEIYYDFKVISGKGGIKEVLYACSLKEIVNDYLKLLQEAGLNALVIDIESASLARAFEKEMLDYSGAFLIVDIGARTTVLTIVDKGFIRGSAIIPFGGNNFTQLIAEKLNFTFQKAEEIKKIIGLDSNKEGGVLIVLMKSIIEDIFGKIKEFINFYEQRSERKVKKIILCGGSSLMPKLIDNFLLTFGIEVKIANPFLGIDTKGFSLEKMNPVFLSNVVGLAKRALEKNVSEVGINLIPKKLFTIDKNKK